MLNMVLILPQGEEFAMSNTGWIIMYCGLSLAARLDLIATRTNIQESAQHLRRFLDMPHVLRQIILRLEVTANPDISPDRDCRPLEDLARRVRRLEEWHSAQVKHLGTDQTTPANLQTSTSELDAVSLPLGDSTLCLNPEFQGPNLHPGQSLDFSDFLFGDPVQFTTHPGPWG